MIPQRSDARDFFETRFRAQDGLDDVCQRIQAVLGWFAKPGAQPIQWFFEGDIDSPFCGHHSGRIIHDRDRQGEELFVIGDKNDPAEVLLGGRREGKRGVVDVRYQPVGNVLAKAVRIYEVRARRGRFEQICGKRESMAYHPAP